MTKFIDAKGLQCPEPVIKVKNALNEINEGVISVLVDNIASRDNVKRFAESTGCTVTIEEIEGDFKLDIVKGYSCAIVDKDDEVTLSKKVIFASSDSIGLNKELGKMLMTGFLKNLLEVEKEILPEKIIFVNEGVNVTCFNNDAIETLKNLEEKGVEIYSCGACLIHFNIEDKLQVGKVGNAYDVAVSLLKGDSVINLC